MRIIIELTTNEIAMYFITTGILLLGLIVYVNLMDKINEKKGHLSIHIWSYYYCNDFLYCRTVNKYNLFINKRDNESNILDFFDN